MKVYEITIKGHVTLPDGDEVDEQTVEEMTKSLLETAYPRHNGYAICGAMRADGSMHKKTATLHVDDVQFGKVELVR